MSQVSDRGLIRARKIYQPLFATIEITQGCNFKCLHCYNFDRRNPPKEKRTPLTAEEIFQVIDGFSELGALNLSFTGGEPMIHPQIFEFIQY